MTKIQAVEPDRPRLKDPNEETIESLIKEMYLFKGNHNIPSERKELIPDIISFRPISNENIRDWLKSFEFCEQNNFRLGGIMIKTNEVIDIINTSTDLDQFLDEICRSEKLPEKLRKTACIKSRQIHG